jgi:hypothetical protein
MKETLPGNTLPLDLCWRCETEARDRDRFCRHCGANLSERTTPFIRVEESKQTAGRDTGEPRARYETAPLAVPNWQRPISGKLVGVVATGVMTIPAGFSESRFVKGVTMILITLPIWLLMILLSPLDAYAATKVITKRI